MGCRQMYVMYYDCGTTNTRGYLLKNNHVVQQAAEQIGAKNSALEKDNHRLLRELFVIYESLLKKEGIRKSVLAAKDRGVSKRDIYNECNR